MSRSWAVLALVGLGCGELAVPRDVSGNYEVAYVDNLRVYLDDHLVAEVVSGEDADFDWNGHGFEVSQLCSDEGVECPGESSWRTVGVDQPWGTSNRLLNFVDLDPDRGELGQRMGGRLGNDGRFSMLSGLDLDGYGDCAAIGVGTVKGTFTPENDGVTDGVLIYEWAGGCTIGGVELGAKIRLETDYTAVRTGDLDLSAIDAEPPVTSDGDPA
ncbi:MAG: hypothetical protein ABMB14_30605 [Myxococcota bacterium]